MNQPKNIIFFSNGCTAVLDENGSQVPEIQSSWITIFAEYLMRHDIDPAKIVFEMPDGRFAKIFSVKDGNINWELCDANGN